MAQHESIIELQGNEKSHFTEMGQFWFVVHSFCYLYSWKLTWLVAFACSTASWIFIENFQHHKKVGHHTWKNKQDKLNVLYRINLLADESNLAHPTTQSEVGSVCVAPFTEKQHYGVKAIVYTHLNNMNTKSSKWRTR